jgi:hypothetical protein
LVELPHLPLSRNACLGRMQQGPPKQARPRGCAPPEVSAQTASKPKSISRAHELTKHGAAAELLKRKAAAGRPFACAWPGCDKRYKAKSWRDAHQRKKHWAKTEGDSGGTVMAGSFCEHQRRRSQCKDCGGGSICEHQRQKSQCKDCGGGSICENQRQKSQCRRCLGPHDVSISW